MVAAAYHVLCQRVQLLRATRTASGSGYIASAELCIHDSIGCKRLWRSPQHNFEKRREIRDLATFTNLPTSHEGRRHQDNASLSGFLTPRLEPNQFRSHTLHHSTQEHQDAERRRQLCSSASEREEGMSEARNTGLPRSSKRIRPFTFPDSSASRTTTSNRYTPRDGDQDAELR